MFELIITIILLGLFFLATRGEKKELEDLLDLEREVSKYNSLTESEKLAKFQAWIERYKTLHKEVIAQNNQEIDEYVKREGTLIGKAANKLSYERISNFAGPKVQRAILEKEPNLKEHDFLRSLFRKVRRPEGLSPEDLESIL